MPRRKKNCKHVTNVNHLDASMIADGTNEEVLKKEAFLRDFDLQVSKRIGEMEGQMKRIMSDINKLFATNKLSVKIGIRKMKKKDFLANGGDWNLLDFTAITNNMSSGNISFQEERHPDSRDETAFKLPASNVKYPTRQITRKRVVAESPLVQEGLSSQSKGYKRIASVARSNQHINLSTPHLSNSSMRNLKTSLITPKFDLRKPLTAAREPKSGETLVSLCGSPVLQRMDKFEDDSNVVSLVLNKEQTILGGSLFDLTMSPNTLATSKERLQEAITAINSRMDDLDMQLTNQSNN